MGRSAGWVQGRTGRSPMRSPGAPAYRRDVERASWRGISTGVTSDRAAEIAGVSSAVGVSLVP